MKIIISFDLGEIEKVCAFCKEEAMITIQVHPGKPVIPVCMHCDEVLMLIIYGPEE